MTRQNAPNYDKKRDYIKYGDGFVLCFGQYGTLGFTVPDGDQNDGDHHHKPVLNGEVTGGVVLHSFAVELHIGA